MILLPNCGCCGGTKECCTLVPCGCTLKITVANEFYSTEYRRKGISGSNIWDGTAPPGVLSFGSCSTVLAAIEANCPSAMPADPSVYDGKCCVAYIDTDEAGCKSVGLATFECDSCCGDGCVLSNQHFAVYTPDGCGPCTAAMFPITGITFTLECDGFQCCECPTYAYFETLCLSASYSFNGCTGTLGNAAWTRYNIAGTEYGAYATAECDGCTLSISVQCITGQCGVMRITGNVSALCVPEGCPTFNEGVKRICPKPPAYSALLGSHAVTITGIGTCATTTMGTFTLTIAEPPC